MKIDKTLLALLALLPAVALAQDAPAGSQWQTEEHHEEELDLHFVVLKTPAIGLAQPTLVFRCFEDTTVAYFNLFDQEETGTFEFGPATIQLDDQEAETFEMQAIDDGHALGFWDGASAIPFIERLFGAQTLELALAPVEGEPIEAAFNIEGLEERIEPLREACGW
ncbi:type VI secretion system-associated protein TagO [Halomonas sp. HNIBRBA4712]|uniref:type VI secretion system-associated protein TagO n=1 Tax=Halomonas sp. HNIBRBA4712 TaxID=3373087 RepID=UPI0037469261